MSEQHQAMARQTQGSLAIVGMIAGGIFLVAFVALLQVGEAGFNVSLFGAALISLLAAIVLFRGFHGKPKGPVDHFSTAYETSRAAAQGQIKAPTVSVPRASAPTASDISASGTGTGTPGQAPSAAESTAAATAATAVSTSNVAASADTAGNAGPGAATDAETSAERIVQSEPTYDDTADSHSQVAQEASSGESPGSKPATLDAPDGEKDDLKLIKGVGPKLENMLNDMGFYHFHQVAAWGPEEVAWVDHNLEGFKGRVSRDDWVDQAKILATGGETEFSRAQKD